MDRRTDIWAFGCILYECLTGILAFEGKTITETLAKILEGAPKVERFNVRLSPDGSLLTCTTKPKFLAFLERIFHRGDAEHAETENAETTDFTDGLQWTRAFAVPQGRRCAPFI